MTLEEDRLATLLERVVPEPPLELSALTKAATAVADGTASGCCAAGPALPTSVPTLAPAVLAQPCDGLRRLALYCADGAALQTAGSTAPHTSACIRTLSPWSVRKVTQGMTSAGARWRFSAK
jgi:hypothetical protein